MTLRALLVIGAIATSSVALTDPQFEYDVATARAFLAKSTPCDLAVGRPLQDPKKISFDVFCVANLVHKNGTIDQFEGCTFMIYNLKTNNYHGTYGPNPEAGSPIATKKKCEVGGFDELLSRKPYFALDDSGPTLKQVLIFGEDGNEPVTQILLATNQHMRDWWIREHDRAIAKRKKKPHTPAK